MSPCGRRRLCVLKTFIVVGVEVCVLFSILLLVYMLARNEETVSQGRGKLPDSRAFIRRLGKEQYQRGLLQNNISEVALIDVGETKTMNVAGRALLRRRSARNWDAAQNHGGSRGRELVRQPRSGQKFLFVLHHYEQLAKTTENLLQLAAVARSTGRVIVQPYVRDSRMCGLRSGWYGEARSPSRWFHPLSLYFNVSLMNSLLARSGYSTMSTLETYKKECAATVTHTHMLHFVYRDQDVEETTRKWFNLSAIDYAAVIEKLKDRGWCECNFIDRGLNISSRIGNVRTGRQICVDPERITSLVSLEKEILLDHKCAVIVHWRGIGRNRTHFRPRGYENTRKVVHSLRPSDFILNGARDFMSKVGLTDEPFLAIHVRSERQIQWYSVDRLVKCVRVLISMAFKLKRRYKIDKVFLSTDFSAFGSDTLFTYAPQDRKELESKLKAVTDMLATQLSPVQFPPPSTPRLARDKGVVAMREMNVLFAGSHLMTVGSGTFQQWIVDVFTEQHSGDNDQARDWTVTRICKEEKRQTLERGRGGSNT